MLRRRLRPAAWAAGAGAAPPLASTFSTSSRRIRPPTPVPGMEPTSRLFSATNRRTSGESITPPARSTGTGAAAGDPLVAAAPAGVAGAVGPAVGSVAPASPIRANGVPTGTVSPAGTRISSRTPSYGLGISESTLSVDTSNSGSSISMVSPALLSQEPMVPSVTVSPSFGMVMSCTTPAGALTPGSSSDGPSEPPICGAAGSPSAGPPAAATWWLADGSRFGTGCAEAPSGTIRTSGVPTGTVSPAATRISAITPSYGLGISESTLSVETSKSGSSNAIASPTFFSQVVSSPSVTVSPSLGMVTIHSSFDMQRSHVADQPCSVVPFIPLPLRSSVDQPFVPSPLRSSVNQPCSERPEKVIMVSPMASDRLGWAWIRRPTSLGRASQLTAR